VYIYIYIAKKQDLKRLLFCIDTSTFVDFKFS